MYEWSFRPTRSQQLFVSKRGSAVPTRWFKYDRDYLCVNKSQFVPVIFEPPCTWFRPNLVTIFYSHDKETNVRKGDSVHWACTVFSLLLHPCKTTCQIRPTLFDPSFLGALENCDKRLSASSCPSVRPSVCRSA